jgi:anti-anti-sigma factor
MAEELTEFRTVVEQTPTGPVIRLVGELDLGTTAAFIAKADPLVAPGVTLTVDLAHVAFCDSAGVNALVRLRKSCDRAGGALLVANPPAQLRFVLQVNGLLEFLNVQPQGT